MNDLSKTPAAELVGEWTEIEKSRASAIKLRYAMAKEKHERRELIAQELDRRCEVAGISIVDGNFVYWCFTEIGMGWELFPKDGSRLNAAEQHALEGWLLMKGGK